MIEWLNTQFSDNQIFSGIVGGSLVASLAFLLKSVPINIGRFIIKWSTISVTVRSDDVLYRPFLEWIGGNIPEKWVRNMFVSCKTANKSRGPLGI
jgi:hypothetical protein